MNGIRRNAVGLLVLVAATQVTRPLWAIDDQTKSTVRSLALEAQADYDAGRFSEAQQKFQQALAVLPVPTLCLWAARSLSKTGKLVQAAELYRRAISLKRNADWVGDGQERAQEEAKSELSALLPRLGKLRVIVKNAPPNARVSINQVVVPPSLLNAAQVVDPGDCEVVVRTSAETKTAKALVPEGGSEQITLVLHGSTTSSNPETPEATPEATPTKKLQPPPSTGSTMDVAAPSKSSAQRTWGWVGITVGALGIATGAVGGAFVVGQHSDAKTCSESLVDCKDLSVTDSYNRWRNISVAGFVVGGVATAVGVTLLLTSPSPTAQSSLHLRLSPGVLSLDGHF